MHFFSEKKVHLPELEFLDYCAFNINVIYKIWTDTPKKYIMFYHRHF